MRAIFFISRPKTSNTQTPNPRPHTKRFYGRHPLLVLFCFALRPWSVYHCGCPQPVQDHRPLLATEDDGSGTHYAPLLHGTSGCINAATVAQGTRKVPLLPRAGVFFLFFFSTRLFSSSDLPYGASLIRSMVFVLPAFMSCSVITKLELNCTRFVELNFFHSWFVLVVLSLKCSRYSFLDLLKSRTSY